MNRYLYRAKRTDNGEWVEGYLLEHKNDYYICENAYQCMESYSSLCGQEYGFGGFRLIDNNTICQCTGLNDKNGGWIWENDIIKIPEDYGYFKLEWEEDAGRWIMNNESERLIVHFDNYWAYEVEVIGNTLDNPELLNI